ncbi:MAG: imidazole glycerol phosphate synthase subunit HisH [Alphaproteobacteria bacterium]|nr:imidazole glycerol phosphate synthase subunit HisH [Alphaproteobacteria bacterium SS10]
MTVVVVDYGSGNLRSVAKAVEKAAGDVGHTARIDVTADPKAVAQADRIVLPGQGAFADCRAGLAAVPGLIDALREHVEQHERPLFGICVGMQLFADEGHEHGKHPGFSWVGGTVDPITEIAGAAVNGLKIPHMGWNALSLDQADHPVLAGVDAGDHVYFAHSYAFQAADHGHLLAHADYGVPLTAMVGRDHIVGTQFHPEKSQAAGLRLLANFLTWRP